MSYLTDMKIFKKMRYALSFSAVFMVAACSTASQNFEGPDGLTDPYEGINRTTLKVNGALDKAILEPVAKGYRAAVPNPARVAVRNFLRNLNSPTDLANQILQGDVQGAGTQVVRTSVNTLIGLGGLIDVAAMEGIAYEPEDLGQTFSTWGVGHGPYLVLPLLGPSSVRDATGSAIDTYADPLRLWLDNTDEEGVWIGRIAANAVASREELLDVLSDLRRNSFDYYATIRSIYGQRRETLSKDLDTYSGFEEF